MSNIQNDFISGIGNTPLIKLRAASEITGCNIYGKDEFLNPGGSVKDRAALALIKDAEAKKLISKGGTVVEGTAGNTGIGFVSCQRYRQVTFFNIDLIGCNKIPTLCFSVCAIQKELTAAGTCRCQTKVQRTARIQRCS